MKCKCIKKYYDLKLKKTIAPDEELIVNKERGKELINAGVAEKISDTGEASAAKKNKVKPKEKNEE